MAGLGYAMLAVVGPPIWLLSATAPAQHWRAGLGSGLLLIEIGALVFGLASGLYLKGRRFG